MNFYEEKTSTKNKVYNEVIDISDEIMPKIEGLSKN